MTKQEILEYFKDINHAYNESTRLDDLSRMLDELIQSNSDEDCISRRGAIDALCYKISITSDEGLDEYRTVLKEMLGKIYDTQVAQIEALPSIQPKPGHCKDCQYFEYDSVSKVDGIPLIVAHEICKKWGDGCKTSEYGYCFLFEPNCEAKMEE